MSTEQSNAYSQSSSMLNSVIFRVALMSMTTWVALRIPGGIPIWSYWVCLTIYFIGFAFLKQYQKTGLRLIWDFAFINIALICRTQVHPIAYLIIFMPMINAINFSGKNSRTFLMVILTVLTFYIQIRPFEYWTLMPLISLWIILGLSRRKYEEWNVERDITQHIDSYFLDPKQIEKPHTIYSKIIDDLNKYFSYNGNGGSIRRITAYRLVDNTLWLINSSSFDWTRSITLDGNDVKKLVNKEVVILKGKGINSYLFYIPKGEIDYVFRCDIYASALPLLNYYRFKYILKLTFSKASTLLSADYRVGVMREKKFNEIKDNVLYVNQAVRVMHFIRNKMTPLSNLIAFHKTFSKIPEESRDAMSKRFNEEVKQADKDLKEILHFADYLLDKSNNPFIDPEMGEIQVSKIFIILSEIVQQHLGTTVSIDQSVIESEERQLVVSTSIIESKILMTDWITNIHKYCKNYYYITMSIVEGILIVHFENDYRSNEDIIQRLIRDINSQSKDAVIEGKSDSHGIHIIKSLAEKLQVEVKASKSYHETHGPLLCLDLKYKTHERIQNTNL